MMSRAALPVLTLLFVGLATWQTLISAHAQGASYQNAGEASAALQQARSALSEARARGERLEAEARRATAVVDRTANTLAAVAARIQQSEADLHMGIALV